jgi:hypothetical protein
MSHTLQGLLGKLTKCDMNAHYAIRCPVSWFAINGLHTLVNWASYHVLGTAVPAAASRMHARMQPALLRPEVPRPHQA